MTDILPTPPKLLVAISVIVIGGILLVLSSFIGSSVVEPNPFAMIGAVFFFPPLLVLAIQQYRGTFRAVPSAATTACILFYIFSGFWIFAFVVTVGDAVAHGTALKMMAVILVPISLLAVTCFAFGWINGIWSRRLRAARDASLFVGRRRGLSLRESLTGIGVIVVMTGITFYQIHSSPPCFAEHIDRSAAPFGLPKDAADVSYCKGFRGTIAFEFSVGEASFRRWVESDIGSIESESSGVSLREVTDPFTMRRYGALRRELNGPESVTVLDGLYYEWSKEDRGVYAAFDRTTGRAYYYFHAY